MTKETLEQDTKITIKPLDRENLTPEEIKTFNIIKPQDKKNPWREEINRKQDTFLRLINNDITKYNNLLDAYIFEIMYGKEREKLQKCDLKSIADAFKKVCRVGLDPTASLQKIHLVPYWNKDTNAFTLNAQVGYRGHLEMLWSNPKVANVYAKAVYEADEWYLEYGSEKDYYKHIPNFKEESNLMLTYAVVKFNSGHLQVVTATPKDIQKSKESSKGAYYIDKETKEKKENTSSPWFTYPDSMARVVPLRRIGEELSAIKCDDEFINEEKENG